MSLSSSTSWKAVPILPSVCVQCWVLNLWGTDMLWPVQSDQIVWLWKDSSEETSYGRGCLWLHSPWALCMLMLKFSFQLDLASPQWDGDGRREKQWPLWGVGTAIGISLIPWYGGLSPMIRDVRHSFHPCWHKWPAGTTHVVLKQH